MRVLDAGHRYCLTSLDGDVDQILSFVQRIGAHYPGNIHSYPGTTSQEVVRALLDRARYVNKQIPCPETEISISLLQAILFLYEERAKRVKGKHISECTLAEIESASVCSVCGHISCEEQHK